ncbi:MAG: Biopolymer transport protein ExbB [Candidatus Dependentiae bacterium ADurb.Bin331]|nr:MAG: Biopolymer transport protein ExbB [Candidatus Dependentiae bacterium ADurb.Bin331]
MIQMQTNPVVLLIAQSDLMTKIVLLILLFLSIFSWALFLYKLVIGAIKRRQMARILHALKVAHTIDEIASVASIHAHTLPGVLMTKNLSVLKSLLESRQTYSVLSDRELELLENNLEQTIDEAIATEESFLPFFAATAAVSPLLGLFGTVWGLIHSFVRIAEKQQADIPTIAPGIAEALITTLAGLMVAIPALMMFHYLNTRVRSLEYLLLRLADKFSWSINTLFIK